MIARTRRVNSRRRDKPGSRLGNGKSVDGSDEEQSSAFPACPRDVKLADRLRAPPLISDHRHQFCIPACLCSIAPVSTFVDIPTLASLRFIACRPLPPAARLPSSNLIAAAWFRARRFHTSSDTAAVMSGGVAEPVNPALAPFTFPSTWKVRHRHCS